MENPICISARDSRTTIPLLELKQHVVLYTETPPGPKLATRLCDYYFNKFPGIIKEYKSTAAGSFLQKWDGLVQRHFLANVILKLRSYDDWGYRFGDGRDTDSWQFCFHGYPPVTEPDNAGVVRLVFPWNAPSTLLLEVTTDLSNMVPCLSGSAGYYLQARAGSPWALESFDRMFGMAHRYWGIDADAIDITVEHMKQGFKSINWLTVIGKSWCQQHEEAIAAARASAFQVIDASEATIFQCAQAPQLGDRNRQEPMNVYRALAQSLLPIQVKEHRALGGTLWTDENTIEYLQRFTAPTKK